MKARIQKSTVTKCPACGKTSSFKQEKETRPGGIEHAYLECVRCGHTATVCYTDPAIREALAEQKALFDAGKIEQAKENAPKLQAMMDDLRAAIEGE